MGITELKNGTSHQSKMVSHSQVCIVVLLAVCLVTQGVPVRRGKGYYPRGRVNFHHHIGGLGLLGGGLGLGLMNPLMMGGLMNPFMMGGLGGFGMPFMGGFGGFHPGLGMMGMMGKGGIY